MIGWKENYKSHLQLIKQLFLIITKHLLWQVGNNIIILCILLKMDIKFRQLLNMENKFFKKYKNIKFRYLYHAYVCVRTRFWVEKSLLIELLKIFRNQIELKWRIDALYIYIYMRRWGDVMLNSKKTGPPCLMVSLTHVQ